MPDEATLHSVLLSDTRHTSYSYLALKSTFYLLIYACILYSR